jgi:hypothetical protein
MSNSSDTLTVILDGLFTIFEFPTGIVAYIPDLGNEHDYLLYIDDDEQEIIQGSRYILANVDGGSDQFKPESNLVLKNIPPKHAPRLASFEFPPPKTLKAMGCAHIPRSSFSGQHASLITRPQVCMASMQTLEYKTTNRAQFKVVAPDQALTSIKLGLVSKIRVRSGPPDPPTRLPSPLDDHSYRAFAASVAVMDGLDLRLISLVTTQAKGDEETVPKDLVDEITAILTKRVQAFNASVPALSLYINGDLYTCPRGAISSFLPPRTPSA